MKVALAHEYFSARGGAEAVVDVFHATWPDAPVYTFFHDRARYGALPGWRLVTSSLQGFPIGGGRHRLLLPLYPAAARGLRVPEDFDVALVSTSAFIKGIARCLGELECGGFPRRHLGGVDDRRSFWFFFYPGFSFDLFRRCFQRRFHFAAQASSRWARQSGSDQRASCPLLRTGGRQNACPPHRSEPDWRLDICVTTLSISIKLRALLPVFPQETTWYILLVSSRKAFHLLDHPFYPKAFREAQWPPTPDGEAGAENHSVIGILGRGDDLLFQTTR